MKKNASRYFRYFLQNDVTYWKLKSTRHVLSKSFNKQIRVWYFLIQAGFLEITPGSIFVIVSHRWPSVQIFSRLCVKYRLNSVIGDCESEASFIGVHCSKAPHACFASIPEAHSQVVSHHQKRAWELGSRERSCRGMFVVCFH